MIGLVIAEAVAIALLALLVAGLLRSHAEILQVAARARRRAAARAVATTASAGGCQHRQGRQRAGFPRRTRGNRPAALHRCDRSADRVQRRHRRAHPVGRVRRRRRFRRAEPQPGRVPVHRLRHLRRLLGRAEPARRRPAVRRPPGSSSSRKGEDEESISALRRIAPPDASVVMSSQAWTDYEVPGSPYFLLIEDGRVTGEGSGTHLAAGARRCSARPSDDNEVRRARQAVGGATRSATRPAATGPTASTASCPPPASTPATRASTRMRSSPARCRACRPARRAGRGCGGRGALDLVALRRVDADQHHPARGAGTQAAVGSDHRVVRDWDRRLGGAAVGALAGALALALRALSAGSRALLVVGALACAAAAVTRCAGHPAAVVAPAGRRDVAAALPRLGRRRRLRRPARLRCGDDRVERVGLRGAGAGGADRIVLGRRRGRDDLRPGAGAAAADRAPACAAPKRWRRLHRRVSAIAPRARVSTVAVLAGGAIALGVVAAAAWRDGRKRRCRMRLAHQGLAVVTPRGWDARIFRRQPPARPARSRCPILHAADFPLPAVRGDYGSGAVEIMGPNHVFLSLIEFDTGRGRLAAVRPRASEPDHARRVRPGPAAARPARPGRSAVLLLRARPAVLPLRRHRQLRPAATRSCRGPTGSSRPWR